MELEYYVKLPGDKQYAMNQMTFRISDVDLPEEYKKLRLQDRLALGQMYLFKQGILFKMGQGDITMEKGKELLDELKNSVLGLLCAQINNGINKKANSGSTEAVEAGG